MFSSDQINVNRILLLRAPVRIVQTIRSICNRQTNKHGFPQRINLETKANNLE